MELFSILGGVGGMLGGVSGLAGTLMGMTQGGGIRPEEAAWRDWTRTTEPVATYMNKTFYNPLLTGIRTPYTPANAPAYGWAPTQSMANLYSGYLGREFGLPETLARSLSSQALQPLKIGNLRTQQLNPAMARSAFGLDPNVLAQSKIGQQAPEAIRQFDYLQNAGRLAQFNLWRTQQLPSLIG